MMENSYQSVQGSMPQIISEEKWAPPGTKRGNANKLALIKQIWHQLASLNEERSKQFVPSAGRRVSVSYEGGKTSERYDLALRGEGEGEEGEGNGGMGRWAKR